MKNHGFVLLLSLIIVATLSAIVAALIAALSTGYRAASVQSNGVKAFWLAEAGIADAIKRIKNNEIVLSDPGSDNTTIQNISLGSGTYSAALVRAGSEITITSTGTVNSKSRTVKQIELINNAFPTAFNYAVFGSNTNTATLDIGNNNSATVVVSGDLFYNATAGVDTVRVFNNSQVINGVVYADQIIGGGTYTPGVGNPNPIPTYPSFSTTSYDNAITTADSAPRSNLTLSGSSNLNLAGQTLYYNTVTVQNSATITGPGTIVARQAVSIKNTASVGQSVNFIGKTSITITDSAVVAPGGTYFSRTTINVNTSANVTSALLAPGSGDNIQVQDNAQFTGIIYADIVNLTNNAIVNGSVVANRYTSNRIANNAHLTFNSSYLPAAVTTGFTSVQSYSRKANSWQEI